MRASSKALNETKSNVKTKHARDTSKASLKMWMLLDCCDMNKGGAVTANLLLPIPSFLKYCQ